MLELDEGKSYIYIRPPRNISEPFVCSLYIVEEDFFKEFFFPLDDNIIEVYFIDRNPILHMNIKSQHFLDELFKKGFIKNINSR